MTAFQPTPPIASSSPAAPLASQLAANPAAIRQFDQFVATTAGAARAGRMPVDRTQTHQSIAHNMIEEAYEAVDAIEAADTGTCARSWATLLQVVLQSQIASDAGEFDINDVCADEREDICRHPHVFGEAQAANAGGTCWIQGTGEDGEKGAADEAADGARWREGPLDGVPTSFPALMQAQKVSRKAASAGFEWDSLDDVWEKVREEVDELRAAYAAAPKAANGKVDAGAAEGDSAAAEQAAASVEDEFGDVLFSLVNVGRRMGIDAENALRATCGKFRRRWSFMEGAAWAQGTTVEALAPEEREALWQQAKDRERA